MPCLPNQCALRTWLADKLDIPISHGPELPHTVDKAVQFEPLFQGLAMQAATTDPEKDDELTPTKEQLLPNADQRRLFALNMFEKCATWPRHGHTDALLPEYRARSPRFVAWTRAAFERALPSLFVLQGLVPIFTLPGNKMFQSTGISEESQERRGKPGSFG